LNVQGQLLSTFQVDSPIFLLIHDQLLKKSFEAGGGTLPFTVYESFVPYNQADDDDKQEVDFPEKSQALRYRPLTYTLDTSPDEAIALRDIVEQASLAILPSHSTAKKAELKKLEDVSESFKGKGKGKSKVERLPAPTEKYLNALTPSEEEGMATIYH
jgi:hypothetical protein